MDLLDLYFMYLLEHGAYKPRAIAHVEKLRAGLMDGTIHARCQREGCASLLFPTVRRLYCSRRCAHAGRKRNRPDTYKAGRAKLDKARSLRRFTARLVRLPSHCQSPPCCNLLKYTPKEHGGMPASCCSKQCLQRRTSRKQREKQAALEGRTLRPYQWR